jgi:hypothetical protein
VISWGASGTGVFGKGGVWGGSELKPAGSSAFTVIASTFDGRAKGRGKDGIRPLGLWKPGLR